MALPRLRLGFRVSVRARAARVRLQAHFGVCRNPSFRGYRLQDPENLSLPIGGVASLWGLEFKDEA